MSTETMTAEERAREIVGSILPGSLRDNAGNERRALDLIASAIRAAENAAYEGAAVMLEETAKGAAITPIESYRLHFAADAILSLRHPDTKET